MHWNYQYHKVTSNISFQGTNAAKVGKLGGASGPGKCCTYGGNGKFSSNTLFITYKSDY